MVDLDRLKIPEATHRRRGGRVVVVTLCILCLAIGFGASRLYGRWSGTGGPKVAAVVVRTGRAGAGQQFTAGGWIEVATPTYPIIVSARVAETIEKLHVKEGDLVEPGQELAWLYDGDIRRRLAVAEAERAAALAVVAKLKAGFRTEDIDAGKAAEALAAEKERIAKANYRRSRSAPPGAISAETLDIELAVYKQAEAAHAAAGAALAKLEAGPRVEDIAAAEAKASEAAAHVALAEQELSYCTIVAPDRGTRLRVLRVLQHVGRKVNAGERSALLWLYDPADMQVRVDVTQTSIRSVRIGGEVIVTTEARPERRYKGTVRRIEPLAELAKNTITVRVAIADPDEMLFPEMVAQINFLSVGEEADQAEAMRLPARAVLTDGSQRYVYVIEDAVARRRNVAVGPVAAGQVEIRGGLQSGQRVIVEGVESVADGLPVEEK